MSYESEDVPPHCDQSILHAPGTCSVCDDYPNWQNLRQIWRINFTGEYDVDKAPCPSVYFREVGVRDRWGGNVPWDGYDGTAHDYEGLGE